MTNDNSTFNPAFLLRENAKQFPDKPALIYPSFIKSGVVTHKKMSYREIDEASDKAAYALRAKGFKFGDKTVFMVKAGPELFTLVFALFKIGAIPVVVDPGMGIRRMLHCYRSVGSQTFIGIPVATLVRFFARRMFSTIHSAVTVFRGKIWRQNYLLQGIDVSQPFPIESVEGDVPALISFTTGSTGPAKAVECTQTMVHAMMEAMQSSAAITHDDVQLLTLPFFGVIGMMMGNTCVLPAMDPTKPADIVPAYLEQAIKEFNVTCMFGSPSLLNALGRYGDAENISLPSLRFVSCGGAPMTLGTMKLFRKMIAREAVFETTWGATEGLPLASINIDELLGEMKAAMDSGSGVCIGKPSYRVRVRAMKVTEGPVSHWAEDLNLPSGEIGELIVSGPNISPRYHKDSDSDREHKLIENEEIWHRTGDLGWLDDQGNIWFCGRKTHQIPLREADETLYSVQGEGVANSHPSVYRSALVCADPTITQLCSTPVMCVELIPETLDSDRPRIQQEILALMHESIATKFVKVVLFHDSFPVDIRHNAKIERHILGRWASKQLSQGHRYE